MLITENVAAMAVIGTASLAVALDNSTINNLALLGLAALQAWAMYNSKRNHAESRKEIVEVKAGNAELKEIVNGPFGLALNKLASSQEALARVTKDPEIAVKAASDRKVSDEHNESVANASADKQKIDLDKHKIIAEYEASKVKPPI